MQPYPLRFLKNLNRGREIATVLLNYGFGDLLERLGLRPYLDWGRRLISRKQRVVTRELTTSQRIRLALEDLGPTFVKFGQVLSTRPDLIPRELIQELMLLQERVPPFPSDQARATLEEEFAKPVEQLFKSFDDAPVAAGSLGQVHTAVGHDGRRLAIKIRRPDVVSSVERDLALMLELAQLMEKHIPEMRPFDPVGLVNHFARTIRREMNFRREARTMQEFAKHFENSPLLYVPRVDPDLLSEAVVVMEFVDGTKVDDPARLREWGLDPRQIALNGANIFLRQAFEMGVFHGDPHPGNIRVRRDGSIALLDYGMVGFLDDLKREQLLELVVAIARADVDSAVDVVLTLGRPTTPVDRTLLQADVRDFMEAYYGVPLEHLNVGPMLQDFIGILSNHGLRCPGDLMVLVRAIVTLEGVGRQLDPHFNLATVLSPFVEKLIRQRYEPKRIAERAFADLRTLFKAAHDLPLHLGRTLQKVSQDDLKVKLEHRGLDKLIQEFDRSSNRIVIGMVTSALVVATALIIRSATTQSMWFALPIFLLSGLLGIWLIWGILRSGRL
ncbi:ABC1 kinase family protein [Planctomicrobium sp. SH664]|uniref:ABC1 kinase family protein n=1 Tax=Planctomicrobium sp. SH664 TaxID=3448125 RepID=UPI003F5BB762